MIDSWASVYARDFQTLLKQSLRITNFSGVSFLLPMLGIRRLQRQNRVFIELFKLARDISVKCRLKTAATTNVSTPENTYKDSSVLEPYRELLYFHPTLPCKYDKVWDMKTWHGKWNFHKRSGFFWYRARPWAWEPVVGVLILPRAGDEAGVIHDFLGSVSLILRRGWYPWHDVST